MSDGRTRPLAARPCRSPTHGAIGVTVHDAFPKKRATRTLAKHPSSDNLWSGAHGGQVDNTDPGPLCCHESSIVPVKIGYLSCTERLVACPPDRVVNKGRRFSRSAPVAVPAVRTLCTLLFAFTAPFCSHSSHPLLKVPSHTFPGPFLMGLRQKATLCGDSDTC